MVVGLVVVVLLLLMMVKRVLVRVNALVLVLVLVRGLFGVRLWVKVREWAKVKWNRTRMTIMIMMKIITKLSINHQSYLLKKSTSNAVMTCKPMTIFHHILMFFYRCF